ncbi:guanine permease [Thermococcus celericrescens]|uniref:Guanine permease n=1 Tax=Thermococcus celericrescens TaxID=227598 RepID=A0A124EBI0_9EURY|nr:NCS2 family permease [Thermococcus celericrescens]KUH34072.1 guanine permease [Thermococcus celericrescens]
MGWFENYFEFDRHGTDMKTEILAGVTTFMTMAYILFVNPSILSDAMGKDAFNSLVAVTALAAGFATILMGLYAKKPFALAPGMGLNAYFAYSVVLGMGYDWRVALAAVFVEGLIFIVLSVTKVRSAIIHAIPLSQKYAIGAGIGLFLTFIGLNDVGLLSAKVVAPQGSELVIDGQTHLIGTLQFTGLNTSALASGDILLFFFGLFLAMVLIALRVKGSLLISIITTSVIGWITGVAPWPEHLFSTPDISYTFMQMDLQGLLNVGALGVVFAFFMVDFFDTLGTVTGLSAKAGFITKDGKVPDAEKVLLTDAIGTTVGAILGTSTVTTYIESAAGIEEGGRTGMTALVTGLLFLGIGLFIAPLAGAIPAFATAPTLVIVGYYMLSAIKDVNFADHTEAIPAFLVLITIPYTYSIADGIGIGFISYTILKLFSGRRDEIHPLMYALSIIFLAYFAYLGGAF